MLKSGSLYSLRMVVRNAMDIHDIVCTELILSTIQLKGRNFMAVQLFKLVMSGTTTTTAKPTVYRYISKTTAAVTTTSLFVPRTKFVDDLGNVPAALQTATANNGYYLLFINGELQQSGLFTVGSAGTGITIAATSGITLPISAPITLATTNFAPSSTTTVTG